MLSYFLFALVFNNICAPTANSTLKTNNMYDPSNEPKENQCLECLNPCDGDFCSKQCDRAYMS